MPLQDEIIRLEQQIKEHRLLLSDPELGGLAGEEIRNLEEQKRILEAAQKAAQKLETLPGEEAEEAGGGKNLSGERPLSLRPATMEIRGGAGGDEAKIWADDLGRMYRRFCESIGWKVFAVDDGVHKIEGAPLAKIRNREPAGSEWGPYGLLRFESGVHRVQRVPATEAHGRIHTSTASVAVLPEISAREIEIKGTDLQWQFSRSGGPGGQNVNKVNTAVRLTHLPSQIVVSVRKERFQQQNKQIALNLLRQRLWETEQEKKLKTIETRRRAAVGRGMRAEKIRTYNFPQNRVTDHRTGKSWHHLESILEGNLEKVIENCLGNLS